MKSRATADHEPDRPPAAAGSRTRRRTAAGCGDPRGHPGTARG